MLDALFTFFRFQGILDIESKSVGGIGIMLEHRYYGDSYPNISYPSGDPFDASTDNLRFLTFEQALMDHVRFMQFLDLSHLDPSLASKRLNPDHRPWMWYGGSYPGALSAFTVKGWGEDGTMLDKTPAPHPCFLRGDPPHVPREYRDIPFGNGSQISINISSTAGEVHTRLKTIPIRPLVWGGIASSAVTHAQISFPEYHQAIQTWGPYSCMRILEDAVEAIDHFIDVGGEKVRPHIQDLFGLKALDHTSDFGDALAQPLGYFQAKNWDPRRDGSDTFDQLCGNLTGEVAVSEQVKSVTAKLPFALPVSLMRYATFMRHFVDQECEHEDGADRDDEIREVSKEITPHEFALLVQRSRFI